MKFTYGIGMYVIGSFTDPQLLDFGGMIVGWSSEYTINGRKYSYCVESSLNKERLWFPERDLRFAEPDYPFGIGEEVGIIYEGERGIGTVISIFDKSVIQDGVIKSTTLFEVHPKNTSIAVRRSEKEISRITVRDFFQVGYFGYIPMRYLTEMAVGAMLESDGIRYIAVGGGSFVVVEDGQEPRYVDSSSVPTYVTVLTYPPITSEDS